jgi:hypothetical protein
VLSILLLRQYVAAVGCTGELFGSQPIKGVHSKQKPKHGVPKNKHSLDNSEYVPLASLDRCSQWAAAAEALRNLQNSLKLRTA